MVEVRWDNDEKNVVIWQFAKPWNWNEFYAAKNEVDAMIDTVEGIVDSIFLIDLNQHLPPSAPSHLRTILATRHKRHDMIMIVGMHPFLTALLRITAVLIPGLQNQIYYVSSIDEAKSILDVARAKRYVSEDGVIERAGNLLIS